jgi:hypothetical protein
MCNDTSGNLELSGSALARRPGMTAKNVSVKILRDQRHRERRRLFFAEMLGSNACAATPFGRTVDFKSRPVFKSPVFKKRELI